MFDEKLAFSTNEALPSSATDDNSENYIDLVDTGHKVGEGRPLYIYLYCTTALTGTTTKNLTIDLYEGDEPTGTGSGIDTKVLELLPATQPDTLSTGLIFKIPLPIGEITERYIALNYTAGADFSTMKVSAYLAP